MKFQSSAQRDVNAQRANRYLYTSAMAVRFAKIVATAALVAD